MYKSLIRTLHTLQLVERHGNTSLEVCRSARSPRVRRAARSGASRGPSKCLEFCGSPLEVVRDPPSVVVRPPPPGLLPSALCFGAAARFYERRSLTPSSHSSVLTGCARTPTARATRRGGRSRRPAADRVPSSRAPHPRAAAPASRSYAVMAYEVMAHVAMAHMAMAHIVMAKSTRRRGPTRRRR